MFIYHIDRLFWWKVFAFEWFRYRILSFCRINTRDKYDGRKKKSMKFQYNSPLIY